MRMSQVKEIIKYHHNQIRTQRNKVMSVDNHSEKKLRYDNLRSEKHKHQQSA